LIYNPSHEWELVSSVYRPSHMPTHQKCSSYAPALKHGDKVSLIEAIRNIWYIGGFTDTAEALKLLRTSTLNNYWQYAL